MTTGLFIVLVIVFLAFLITMGASASFVDTFKKVLDFDTEDLGYTSFSIPKKDGTSRQIEAPNAVLKKIQQDILATLSKNIGLPGHITGFRKGYSIKNNAKKHVGKKVVINLDIKDFFTNVTPEKLRQRLEFIKIDSLVIARLEKLCFYNGHLPQGAPTSPFLSNFLFIPVDQAIINLAKKFDPDVVYSRYADNITISSDVSKIANLIRLVESGIVPKFGYELKNSKTTLSRSHTRQTVTGIVVNEKISMPREKYMRLRAKVHTFLMKGTGNPQELAGHLAFLYLIDQKKYRSLEKKYREKLGDTGVVAKIFCRNPDKEKYVFASK